MKLSPFVRWYALCEDVSTRFGDFLLYMQVGGIQGGVVRGCAITHACGGCYLIWYKLVRDR